MRYAPAIWMVAGLALVGLAIYQIDNTYLTLTAGIILALIGLGLETNRYVE